MSLNRELPWSSSGENGPDKNQDKDSSQSVTLRELPIPKATLFHFLTTTRLRC
jgi:hypothetical protein